MSVAAADDAIACRICAATESMPSIIVNAEMHSATSDHTPLVTPAIRSISP